MTKLFFKYFLFLNLYLYCNHLYAAQDAALIVCTVTTECKSVMAKYPEEHTALTGSAFFSRNFFKLRIVHNKRLFLLSPRNTGHNQNRMQKDIASALQYLNELNYDIKLIIGYGTAGSNTTQYAAGDIIYQTEFEYLPIVKENIFQDTKIKELKFNNIKAVLNDNSNFLEVPYNKKPKLHYGECQTVNTFISLERKAKLKKHKCFQKNDYIIGTLASKNKIDFFAIRVISDSEIIPETFRLAQYANRLWQKAINKEDEKPYCIDCYYYSTFLSYYLVNAAKVLDSAMKHYEPH